MKRRVRAVVALLFTGVLLSHVASGPIGLPSFLSGALTGDGVSENDQYGQDVAVSGDWMLVGECNEDDFFSGREARGAVHFLERAEDGWTERQRWAPEGAAYRTGTAGCSVDIDGDLAVVGAFRVNDRDGIVFLLRRGGNGVWKLEAELDDGKPNTVWSRFGVDVAVSGETVVVGSDEHESGDLGTVYVFENAGSGRNARWRQVAALQPPEVANASQAQFGHLVDVAGDVIVMSAVHIEAPPSPSGCSQPPRSPWRTSNRIRSSRCSSPSAQILRHPGNKWPSSSRASGRRLLPDLSIGPIP